MMNIRMLPYNGAFVFSPPPVGLLLTLGVVVVVVLVVVSGGGLVGEAGLVVGGCELN